MLFFKRKKPTATDAPASHSSGTAKSGSSANADYALKKTETKWKKAWALFKKTSPEETSFYNTLEEAMINSDIGKPITTRIIHAVQNKNPNSSSLAINETKRMLKEIVSQKAFNADALPDPSLPQVTLMVGINGAGKTTTMAKLCCQSLHTKKPMLMVAGDTYRAAAIEQLQMWGDRINVEVFKREQGMDPAAVAYQAIEYAVKKNCAQVFIDTSGRLNNQSNLMAELKKIKMVLSKHNPLFPQHTFLVIDANYGQHAIKQAKGFLEALETISGIILSKCDGNAKGGAIFSITEETGIPVAYLGTGEGLNDLKRFDANAFVDELFSAALDTGSG